SPIASKRSIFTQTPKAPQEIFSAHLNCPAHGQLHRNGPSAALPKLALYHCPDGHKRRYLLGIRICSDDSALTTENSKKNRAVLPGCECPAGQGTRPARGAAESPSERRPPSRRCRPRHLPGARPPAAPPAAPGIPPGRR